MTPPTRRGHALRALADAIDAVVTMAGLVPELMLELEGLNRLVSNLRVEADRADCGCSRCAQGSLASQGDA